MRAAGTVISLNHLSIMANIQSVVRPSVAVLFGILVVVEPMRNNANLRRRDHV
jgi:hypothetical protein